jgi:small-conductance mechanosensitive channel
VEYEADTDRVVAVVRQVGAELMGDPAFAPFILEPIEVLGVDDFKDSSVTLKIRIKTVPLKQWEVGRELRRRMKMALDREGIRIPSPRLDVTISGVSGVPGGVGTTGTAGAVGPDPPASPR